MGSVLSPSELQRHDGRTHAPLNDVRMRSIALSTPCELDILKIEVSS